MIFRMERIDDLDTQRGRKYNANKKLSLKRNLRFKLNLVRVARLELTAS